MVAMFAAAAIGEPIEVANPLDAAQEYYLVRDIDALPGVFSASDLLEGASGEM